jgi:methionine-rich copper-binding protein CopC
MKALTYIFAIIFTIISTSNSFASNKVTDKKPSKVSKIELRTEILTLIEEDAVLEAGRNIVLDSLTFTSNFLINLIEEDAANETNVVLDTNKSLELGNLENLSENNANTTVDIKLNTININENALLNFIENNANIEVVTTLKSR